MGKSVNMGIIEVVGQVGVVDFLCDFDMIEGACGKADNRDPPSISPAL